MHTQAFYERANDSSEPTTMTLAAVLAAGAAGRFAVPALLPQISASLASTPQISTPLDSFRSVREALFFLDHGIDVYDGGVVHHPPLLVAVFKIVHDTFPRGCAELVYNLVFAAVDVGVALKLVALNKWYNRHQGNKVGRPLAGFSDSLVAALYLFNPLMVLTSWAHSTQPLTYFLIVELMAQVLVDKNAARGAIALAVAAYFSFTPVFLVVPLAALAYAVAPARDWRVQIFQTLALFFAALTTLLLLSFVLTALPDFLWQCYWPVLLFLKIAPNMGLWWYLFTEMFDFFTPLYRGIFNLYSVVFVVPLTVRLFEPASQPRIGDSFLAVVLCYLWLSFSKPYPVVGDLGFAMSMFPIFKNTVIPRTKFLPATALLLIVCLLLAPIFYYCWIVLGNGNSNFFYSMDLVWAGVHVLLFLDLIWGRLVYDYIQTNDVEKPDELRLTQI